jgi:AcrR family transcriptional regulator
MRRTKEEAEQTRQAILVAAEKLFAKKGVAKVSLEQIAETLGLTRGAVRWHFRDKKGLLLALLDTEGLPLDELAGPLEIEPTLDPLDELVKLTARLLGELQSDPKRQQLTKQLINFADAEAPERRRGFDQRLRAGIRAVFKLAAGRRLLVPEWSADKAAIAYHAMVSGLVAEWLRGGADFDLRTDLISLLRTFVKSVRANGSSACG